MRPYYKDSSYVLRPRIAPKEGILQQQKHIMINSNMYNSSYHYFVEDIIC